MLIPNPSTSNVLPPGALILGIDTSGRQGSVALLQTPRDDHAPLRTLDFAPLTGGQYSEVLIPALAAMLQRHGFQKHDLALIAVASGPGSFTGLRVTIATAKGLAEAFAIPVVAVSVLEAVALTASTQGLVVTALDAQRNEIFFGEFNLIPNTGLADTIREDITTFPGFTNLFPAAPALFTCDELLAARLREAVLNVALVARPTAEDVARIAHRKFLAGIQSDVATLDCNYLRRSDAELLSAPKLGVPRQS